VLFWQHILILIIITINLDAWFNKEQWQTPEFQNGNARIWPSDWWCQQLSVHTVSVTVGQLAAMDFSVWSTSRSTCRWGDLFAWLPSARYTSGKNYRYRQAGWACQTHAEGDTLENWWREDVSSDGVCEHVRRLWNCDDLTFRWIHRCK